MVKVYSINDCPWCDKVKKYLKSKGIAYEECNLEESDEAREACVRLTRDTAVPVVTVNDADYVLGLDKAKIDVMLGL